MNVRALTFLLVLAGAAGLSGQEPDAASLYRQAQEDFRAGRVRESAAGFDKLAVMVPDGAPMLWQRGIALYYVKRYEDCRLQFESHRTVNPDDVENAAWHYLCVARQSGAARAQAALLPVGPDPRVPMREIYRMYKGELLATDVLKAAGSREEALFSAHLYIGLWYEAQGNRELARKHIAIAAQPRFANFGGYMHDVALIHLRQ
jgi:lipoprotein NlpI